MVTTYPFGSLVKISCTFTQLNGTTYDPTTVTVKVKNPAGTISTYVYGINGEVIRDNLGVYHMDVNANAGGSWWYRFAGDVLQAANEGKFTVSPTQF